MLRRWSSLASLPCPDLGPNVAVAIRTPDTDPTSLHVSNIRCFFGQYYRNPEKEMADGLAGYR
jgi:hypothetical protein